MKAVFTKSIILVSLVSLFTDIASEMLYPVMPLYLNSIGFSVLFIGILEGIAEATAGLSKGFFGELSDRKGRRAPFIQFGYGLSAFSKPLMVLLAAPLWVFLMRTLDRLGKGIRTSARDALLSDETTKENKGKVFGFHRAMDTFGALIGPVLALLFLHYFPSDYKWLFILSFIPGLLSMSITFLIRDRKRQVAGIAGRRPARFLTYLKSSPGQYRILFAGLICFALFNSSDMFILLKIKATGFSDSDVILFYVFYNLIYALTSLPMGIIADRLSLKAILIFGLILFSVVYAGLAIFELPAIYYILLGIYGIYAASTEGISKALITNIVPENETATAIGTYSAFNSVMLMISSMLTGLIWMNVGPQAAFLISAVGALIAAIFLLIKFKA